MKREPRGRSATTRSGKDELKELERQARNALKAVVVPPYAPLTPEEIARRRAIGKRMDAFREAMGEVAPTIIAGRREGLAGEDEDNG